MIPARVIEKWHTSRRATGRSWRSLSAWTRLPSSVSRLVLVPVDLMSPDPGFLDEAARGVFCLGEHTIEVGLDSPFTVAGAPDDWSAELHGFSWLGHLRADGSVAAASMARRLVTTWMAQHRRQRGLPFRRDVLATRVTSWLVNAGLLLDDADPGFYRAVLASLGRQMRLLDAERHRAGEGTERLFCLIALLQAALAIGAGERHVRRLLSELVAELRDQILPDGAHVTRNAAHVVEILARLLPLHRCCQALDRPSEALGEAIGRMIAHLRFMRLGDGTLARFNGCGATRRDLLGMVLASDPDDGAAIRNRQAAGYVRLECAETVVLIDAGRAPPLAHATAAHAGCLAFETSWGRHSLLRSGGAPRAVAGNALYAARATSSHNTLVLDARSSAKLVEASTPAHGSGARPIRGPDRVTADVEELADALVFVGAHDGWVEDTGVVHFRRLVLSSDGRRLVGVDRLAGATGVLRLPVDLPFAIHFHLAAGVGTRVDADGQGATLTTEDSAAQWRLAVTGARVSLEPSTDWANVTGPRPSRQLVLRASTPGESTVSWSLEIVDEGAA
jgi:uncharacterized heparinase superfamily protein